MVHTSKFAYVLIFGILSLLGVRRTPVWVLGHSFVHRAAQRASYRPGGRSLGIRNINISWRGVPGLRWLRTLPEVVAISKISPGPIVLVIHAGGNYLCYTWVPELLSVIQPDMDRFRAFLQDLLLVWSGERNPAVMERARRLINSRVSRWVRSSGVCSC